jgi:hypothetical protein
MLLMAIAMAAASVVAENFATITREINRRGASERTNQVVEIAFRYYLAALDDIKKWEEILPRISAALSNSTSRGTGLPKRRHKLMTVFLVTEILAVMTDLMCPPEIRYIGGN